MKLFLQSNKVIIELEDGKRIARTPGGIDLARHGDHFIIRDKELSDNNYSRHFSLITDQAGTSQATADDTENYLIQNIYPQP